MSDTLPDLATCSYRAFRVDMGLPVRVARPPRPIPFQMVKAIEACFPDDPALVGQLQMKELVPAKELKGLPVRTFAEEYNAGLDKMARQIEKKLSDLADHTGQRLVLVCKERFVSGPADCHRRLFAEWWEARTGVKVPELDAGR